jgi:uncharacterized membrane protein YcaP (DUF421 family)
MAKEHVSIDELYRQLREHGCCGPQEVALAVLEVDGSVSVLKYDDVPEPHKVRKRMRFLQRN